MKAELLDGLNASAAYSYTDVEVTKSSLSGEVGHTPMQVPRETASIWLDYTPGNWQGIGFGGGVRYVGKRFNDAENTSAEGGYTLADATVHYERGAWRLALNLNNVFDKSYYASHAYGEYQPGEQRNLLASAKYRF